MPDEETTVTFRISSVLKGHVAAEAKARDMTLTSFVKEALEREVIRSARRRSALLGCDSVIDLTKDEDD